MRDWHGKQKIWWKERRGRHSSAACYSRCHLFQSLLISAWTYLLGRKLNIDLFFSLHSNPRPLFFFTRLLFCIDKTTADGISNVTDCSGESFSHMTEDEKPTLPPVGLNSLTQWVVLFLAPVQGSESCSTLHICQYFGRTPIACHVKVQKCTFHLSLLNFPSDLQEN